jgi:hypothetical protein
MQLYCQDCRAWIKVHVEDGEADAHAGLRARREHRCMSPVREAFDEIVAHLMDEAVAPQGMRGTTGTTPP